MGESETATIFEEHHEVLAHWFARNVSAATVVCFDAHLDLQPISQTRMNRLLACETADQVRALGKRHHLLPDGESSYSIEDFFFAAAKLKLVDHLVWVAPSHVRLEPADGAIEQFRELPGITDECLQSIKKHRVKDAVCLQADLWGLHLTICRLESLPALRLPSDSLIDIDIDYFVELPAECLGETPASVAATIAASGLDGSRATISRSIESGFTPLRYRFLAEWMAESIKDPSHRSSALSTAKILADVHQRLRRQPQSITQADADKLLDQLSAPCGAGAVEFALSQVYRALPKRGESAMDDNKQADEFLRASIAKEKGYALDPVRLANEFPNRQIPVSTETVASLEQWLETRDAEGSFDTGMPAEDARAIGESAIGLLWCHLQQWNRAEACFARTTPSRNASCELALELARSFMQRGSAFGAIAYLQIALDDDKTRPSAILLMAIAHQQTGDIERTKDLLGQLIQMTPAWPEPRRLLGQLEG